MILASASPRLARVRPYVPALVVSGVLGAFCVRAVLGAAGEPAAPLDDAFIHLQFARRLAEGSFYGYVPGEGYSSGATSLLWPALLAPFHRLGLTGLSLIYASWALGTVAHAAVLVETTRLAGRLSSKAGALGAGAMSACFAAFAWFAWSGMETVAVAWALLRAARLGAEWCEAGDEPAPRGAWKPLVAMAVVAPLLRPEGMVASLIAAAALAWCPRGLSRAVALAPLAGPAIVPLLNRIFLGHATSATAQSKWLLASPYHHGEALRNAVRHNVGVLLDELSDGRGVVSLFLPEGTRIPFLLALLALVFAARRRQVRARALFTLAVALGALIPCTYGVMLWHRGRYFFPFTAALFVGVACLAQEIAGRFRRGSVAATALPVLLPGLVAGALLTRLPGAVHDLAQSAKAIDRQQVTLARWAAEKLPPDALVGLNDTGALTYLGKHRTFDIVGLTTEGEARYWSSGPASRFEHYEKLPRERLPTHFIVYATWMNCPPVLGQKLHEVTVPDQQILGSPTMGAYLARWDLLGSGALPVQALPRGRLADELDVADVESEAEHGLDLVGATMRDEEAPILDVPGAPGRHIADGARTHRRRDRFTLRGHPGVPGRLVLRVSSEAPAQLAVRAGGKELGRIELRGGAWVEPVVEIAAAEMSARLEIEVTAERPRDGTPGGKAGPPQFSSFHYWLYTDD